MLEVTLIKIDIGLRQALEKLDMRKVGEVIDLEDGPVWRWSRNVTS